MDAKLQNIKCILFDLDGTLLRSRPTLISQESGDILNQLQQKGYLVGFCTGRPLTALDIFLRPIGLHPNIPSIGCCGGEIGIAGDPPGNAMFLRPFPTEILPDMLMEAYRCGLQFSLDGHGTLYTSNNLDYFSTYLDNYKQAQSLGLFFPKPTPLEPTWEDLERVCDGTVVKPMLWYRNKSDLTRMNPWFRAHPDLHYHSSGYSLVEVQTNDVSKAHCLRMLVDHLGISLEECCVFGDSENDLPVMEIAGISVAVQNAYPEVKAIADYIAEGTNNEDGAAKMAAKLFLE